MKILFLDIDGVLNCHDRYPNGYCGIHPDKVQLLEQIIQEIIQCRIVLVSAWRYLILGGDMTLRGFGHMLRTYGASNTLCNALYDYLPEDQSINDPHDRGKLATLWLETHGQPKAVALDDGSWPDGFDLGYKVMGIPSVQPIPTIGLTLKEVHKVIEAFE